MPLDCVCLSVAADAPPLQTLSDLIQRLLQIPASIPCNRWKPGGLVDFQREQALSLLLKTGVLCLVRVCALYSFDRRDVR